MQETNSEIEFPQYILKNLIDKYSNMVAQERREKVIGL